MEDLARVRSGLSITMSEPRYEIRIFYSEHIEAARRFAAPSYREEVRRLMAAGTLDPEED